LGSSNLILLIQPGIDLANQFVLGFILSLLISIISKKLNFLTNSGAFAVFILAFLIFGFGGWQWTIPILSFFVVSSLLTNIREKKNPSVSIYFEKSGKRDAYQVAANGGIGGILVVLNYLFPYNLWFYVYSGIIASSCADTWATEIGTMNQRKTFSILDFKMAEQGTSGGISIFGLIGAIAGALFISMISVLWIDNNQIDFILAIVFSAFAASVIDSILGGTIQIQYRCSECSRIIDNKTHCGKNAVKVKGINIVNNDIVNLISGLMGGFIVYSLTVR
jgi:uncharacterized protein (TIGR00297 family)